MYTFKFKLNGIHYRLNGSSLKVTETGTIMIVKDHNEVAAIPAGTFVVAEEVVVN